MLNTHVNPLGQDLALDLLVDNNADSMLSYVVDTSCFAMVALVRHTLLNGACALDVDDVSLLVDAHVCGQGNWAMLAECPAEHVPGPPPLASGVRHDA